MTKGNDTFTMAPKAASPEVFDKDIVQFTTYKKLKLPKAP